MTLLGQRLHTLRRYAEGDWVAGEFVAGDATESDIRGTDQPLSGDDLQTLPEADRTRRTRKLYTRTLVRTALQSGTPDGNVIADEIDIDDVTYQVRKVERQPSVIAHYKVLLVALREA